MAQRISIAVSILLVVGLVVLYSLYGQNIPAFCDEFYHSNIDVLSFSLK